ncbi:MAG TPA: DUF979 domain-containing protein [Rhizomicrobium sp.]|nr:DUF979 domain-containing protein [Rhizomicrobium sp.]
MITLHDVYVFAGLVFVAIAALSARDASNPRRFGNALFWGLIAVSFLFGSWLGDIANGILALALAALGGFRLLGVGVYTRDGEAERVASAYYRGDMLFLPALLIPVTAMLGTVVLKNIIVGGAPLIEPKQATVISLALGVAIAWVAASLWLREQPVVALQEGRRLMDAIGWASVLPQMLASLGAVFAVAGVGRIVGELAANTIPLGTPFATVVAYCLGMAVFTIVMGNAFAAFPVMTAAIGLPLVVHRFHGDPAIMAAIGMLSGFCGTLVTPMAANFNIVPTALLGLDRNAVIRTQWPTALLLLFCNTLLMYFLVFRFGTHHT